LDYEFILSIFSDNRELAIKEFIAFNELECETECLDENRSRRLTDEEAKLEVARIIPINEIAVLKSMPKLQRDPIIMRIKEIEGLTQRQVSRILGVAPNLIFRTK